MGLPLQPDLQQPKPHRWRWLIVFVGLLSLTVLAWFAPSWQPPARLLTNTHQEWHYLTQIRQHIAKAESQIDAIVYVAHIGEEEQTDHPMRLIIADLAAAQQRGVSVRVILDRSPDWGSSTISSKNDNAAQALAEVGIPVFGDEENRTTHCKGWVFDQRWVVVGSHNWTRSAATRNREWSLLVDDRKIAKQMTHIINSIATVGRRYPLH